jgi:hypothetical protein
MKRGYFSKSRLPGLMAGLCLAVLIYPGLSLGVGLDHDSSSAAPPPTVQFSHRAIVASLFCSETAKPVKYYHRGPGIGLWFTDKEINLMAERGPDPGKAVVRLQPVGMSSGVKLQGAKPQAGKINFFTGRDPAKWRTGIPIYSEVVYREAYPGTDLIFYGIGRKVGIRHHPQAGRRSVSGQVPLPGG